MTFDPVQICQILNEERVEYVVIGGFAAVIHGSALPTIDVDVLPSRSADNLDRLGRALTRMNAMIRTANDPVPTRLDGRFLASMPLILNLVTDHGELDLVFAPAGNIGGFAEWNANAATVDISEGIAVRVGALDDVIASKRGADRPKDQRALPYLESLRDQIEPGDHD